MTHYAFPHMTTPFRTPLQHQSDKTLYCITLHKTPHNKNNTLYHITLQNNSTTSDTPLHITQNHISPHRIIPHHTKLHQKTKDLPTRHNVHYHNMNIPHHNKPQHTTHKKPHHSTLSKTHHNILKYSIPHLPYYNTLCHSIPKHITPHYIKLHCITITSTSKPSTLH